VVFIFVRAEVHFVVAAFLLLRASTAKSKAHRLPFTNAQGKSLCHAKRCARTDLAESEPGLVAVIDVGLSKLFSQNFAFPPRLKHLHCYK
jgi:hypothetical protein